MARLLKVLFAGLLIILALAGSACADEVDEWNRLDEQCTALAKETNALDAQGGELMGEVVAIDPYAENAADALPPLAEAQALLAELTEKLESFAALLDQMADLDVSEEHGFYVGQQEEIAETLIEYYAATSDALALEQTLYDPSQTSRLSQAGIDRLEQEEHDLWTRAEELYSPLDEMQRASDLFYRNNILRLRPWDSTPVEEGRNWAGWVAYLTLASACALACGIIARKKNRNIVGWAIFGFVTPVITLVAILVVGRVERLLPTPALAARPLDDVPADPEV